MATRAQKVKLGVFLLAAAALFVAVVLILSGAGILKKHSTYFIAFRHSVSGLAPGLPVRLSGVRVGTIKKIDLDPDNVELVRVEIQVDRDTPIKTDTVAYIDMQGITGLKYIELKESTQAAPRLPSGGSIPPGPAMLDEIKDRATDIARNADQVLSGLAYLTREENLERVDAIMANTQRASGNLDALGAELTRALSLTREIAQENRQSVRELLANANQASARSAQAIDEISALSRTVRQILQQADIPQTVADFRQTNHLVQEQLQQMADDGTLDSLGSALDQLVLLLQDLGQSVRQNKEQVRQTVDNLREASESFKEMARSLRAQPSRLLFDNPPKPRQMP